MKVGATKAGVRWILLIPTVVIAWAAVAVAYAACHSLLVKICPRALRLIEGTTDLSSRGHTYLADTCSAKWYPAAEVLLLAVMLVLVICSSALVGYSMAPRRKMLAGGLCMAFTSFLLVLAFSLPDW